MPDNPGPIPPGEDDPSRPYRQEPQGRPIDPPQGGAIGTENAGESAAPGGEPIGPDEAARGAPGLAGADIYAGGAPIGGRASLFNIGGAPVSAGSYFIPGTSVQAAESFRAGGPVGGPASIFNIGGAPIAILGGVFSGGLPIGGPVSQVFRGVGPEPNTLFIATISPSGPIGTFLIGTGGSPIGEDVFGGGGLPISAPEAQVTAVEAIQPRTALVAIPEGFGGGQAQEPAPPIGGNQTA